ncbi:hypothetical protein P879_02572 [Paragonimus westermani]|uniref:Vasohibin-2 n=1 Tax=Paragonimus westermani TaxID=34504 RepID=A0A8T0DPU4_9TREM|nr:hypothetical protein P879_02572 [Paragonimus westermani]
MQFFPIDRSASLDKLRESAKLIIEACLPIKCLEATVLAIFLTQDQKEFKRFTISFSSEFDGQTFRHVVLGVYANGKYGALGLSRRPDLMYKPLEFPTLATLIHSYAVAYVGHYHRLVKVKLGLPIPHQPHLFETLPWKASLGIVVTRNLFRRPVEVKRVLDQYSRIIRGQMETVYLRHPHFRLPALSSSISGGSSGDSMATRRTLIQVQKNGSKTTTGKRCIKRAESDSTNRKQPKILTHSQYNNTDHILAPIYEQPKPVANSEYRIRI